MKKHSFLEKIITSRQEVFKDYESEMAVGIGKLGDPTQETADCNDPVNQTTGCYILTVQLQVTKADQ
jgi:hypothetical protein